MMIINDDTGVINKLGASLTDGARVVIYDCHMLIVQATRVYLRSEVSYIAPLRVGSKLTLTK